MLMAVNFDWTITLGTIIQTASTVAAIIGGYYAVRGRLDRFADMLEFHTESLNKHALRLDKHEEKILDLVGGLQRIIGQNDVIFRTGERRQRD